MTVRIPTAAEPIPNRKVLKVVRGVSIAAFVLVSGLCWIAFSVYPEGLLVAEVVGLGADPTRASANRARWCATWRAPR